MGGFDGRLIGEGFQEIHSASAGTMKKRAVGGVGNEFWNETRATVAHGKGYFVILGLTFQLHFAGTAFLASMPNRVRYALGKRKQHVMPKLGRNAGAVELLARPFVDLFQLVQSARYEQMIHVFVR